MEFEKKVERKYKRFHKSDALVYEYNLIEHPVPTTGGVDFSRRHKLVYASPNVTWQDIAKEAMDKRMQKDTKHEILFTCMVDYPEFVVVLTLKGFIAVLEGLPSYGRYTYDEQIENLAKELIAQRDFDAYASQCRADGVEETRKFSSFWPK